MNTLFIETSDAKIISVKLTVGENMFEETRARTRTQETLPIIENLIGKANIMLTEIDRIEVNRGPGSFTGLRVGVAIANALSFALDISVNDKKNGEWEEPHYS